MKKKKKYHIDPSLVNEIFHSNQKQNKQNKQKNINYKKIHKLKKQQEILKLKEKYPALNPSSIGQIILGQKNLQKELIKAKIKRKKEKRKKKILKKIQNLIQQYPDMLQKTAKKIASKTISINDYLISKQKKEQYKNKITDEN